MPCQPVSTVAGRGGVVASDITSSSPSPPYYISSARPAPAVMCVCKPKASETSITSVGRFKSHRYQEVITLRGKEKMSKAKSYTPKEARATPGHAASFRIKSNL
ncbi:hypothetical protein TNCV_4695661 [Trichonephila clavipes]|nr:hypothetical protein TNCV_4695661 [Trichonephila clavipes]